MIARVIVDLSLNREFEYAVPDALLGTVAIGSQVEVPFGHRKINGYVIGLAQSATHPGSLKPLTRVIGSRPMLDDAMLQLTSWMARYYKATVEQCIRTALPSAVRSAGKGAKQRLFVRPLLKLEKLLAGELAYAGGKLSKAQRMLLEVLVKRPDGCFKGELLKESGCSESPLTTLKKHAVVEVAPADQRRDPLEGCEILPSLPLELMPSQAEALATILRCMEGESPCCTLLFGVTGSGKTEVYLQAMARAMEEGKGAICLVPEISLTPQTVERFRSRFGDRVAILHSHLSDGERHDEWHRIQLGEARIVVGARSAVFAPIHNLGLIVVDEEHEPSYKQSEAPRYNARDVAVMRGHFLGCAVVLGSATPALESWVNAKAGKYRLCELPVRADDRKLPHVHVVDMRLDAAANDGRMNVFSKPLITAIGLRLERGEQTMLFLNRRGYAPSLICQKCGYVSECEWCSVSHTYHRHDDRLRCHICARELAVPSICPECKDPAFKYQGVGTQRIETVLHKCFPQARVRRMDADTTRRKAAYDEILGDFRAGKVDILVGTQMIAKGLHFPNVTLVGVVMADLSLHMPDFRAGERTFQLLAQVAGRAGRGEVEGEVVVQTFTPLHPAIEAARRCDYVGQATEELSFRQELSYPPYGHLIAIELSGPREPLVAACGETLAAALQKQAPENVIVSDVCPAPLAKAKGRFRYQVLVRGPSVYGMNAMLDAAMPYLGNHHGVRIAIDVDALQLG